jgi:glycosyltransferase involved in cell wall biosynthesis
MIDSLEIGGSERQYATVARALDRKLFDVSLGCLQHRGAFLRETSDVTEFSLGGSFVSRRAHKSRSRLANYLRARETELVHSFDFYSNLTLIPTARYVRIPVIIGSHRQLGDLLTPLQFAAQKAVFWLCDRVVCNSRAAANSLIDHGLPKSKVVVIHNALPADAFTESVPALPRAPESFRIGFIARMNDPVKNHAGFLRAAARLASKLPGAQFVLVGDGSLRASLECLARQLGLAGKTQFLGDRRDITAVLAALDVSVVFSFSESLSNVILESMAAGLPVVATRVGGTSEVLRDGETGILVAPGGEEELAAALEKLATQPALRAEYGQKARKIAKANFSLEIVISQYEQLYLKLLAEKIGARQRQSSAILQ